MRALRGRATNAVAKEVAIAEVFMSVIGMKQIWAEVELLVYKACRYLVLPKWKNAC